MKALAVLLLLISFNVRAEISHETGKSGRAFGETSTSFNPYATPNSCSTERPVSQTQIPPPPPLASTIPTPKKTVIPGTASCQTNADCVPQNTCHPTACVNPKDIEPGAPICTAVCSGPLDCGAGSCACSNNVCAIVVN